MHFQAKQANEKGISAILINEDNTSDASVWRKAEKSAQLVYLSPEWRSPTDSGGSGWMLDFEPGLMP